jgi:hypothetical protein
LDSVCRMRISEEKYVLYLWIALVLFIGVPEL